MIPLLEGGEAVGAIDFQSEQPGAFDLDDVAVGETLAEFLVVALRNARLVRRRRREAGGDSRRPSERVGGSALSSGCRGSPDRRGRSHRVEAGLDADRGDPRESCSRAPIGTVRPSSRSRLVTPRSRMPQGTISPKGARSLRDVEGEAVRRHPARDAHADGADLLVARPRRRSGRRRARPRCRSRRRSRIITSSRSRT